MVIQFIQKLIVHLEFNEYLYIYGMRICLLTFVWPCFKASNFVVAGFAVVLALYLQSASVLDESGDARQRPPGAYPSACLQRMAAAGLGRHPPDRNSLGGIRHLILCSSVQQVWIQSADLPTPHCRFVSATLLFKQTMSCSKQGQVRGSGSESSLQRLTMWTSEKNRTINVAYYTGKGHRPPTCLSVCGAVM